MLISLNLLVTYIFSFSRQRVCNISTHHFPLLLLPYLAVVFLHISAHGDGFLNRCQFHMAIVIQSSIHGWLSPYSSAYPVLAVCVVRLLLNDYISGFNLLCTFTVESLWWNKVDVTAVDPSIPCGIWWAPHSKITDTVPNFRCTEPQCIYIWWLLDTCTLERLTEHQILIVYLQ